MNYCVKCGRNLHPNEARWFAPSPIGHRAVKCQTCGPFTGSEVAYIAQQLSHRTPQPQVRRMGGCGCRGNR
jgi:DNA-directed RNA polymerase subunit RPC12/RpoP